MKPFLLKLAAGTFLLSLTTSSFAVVEQSLEIPLTFEHETNTRLSATDEQSNNTVALIPRYSIKLNYGSDLWFADASIRIEQSSDQTISQDRNDPSLNIGWIHDYETGQFSVSTLYSSQSTRVSELTSSGIASGDNTNDTRSVSASWLNNINERTSLTLGSHISAVNYTGTSTAALVDFRNESIDANLNYSLTDKVGTFIQTSFSRYIPDDVNSINSETKSADVGVSWNVNEKLNLTASAGTNKTKSKINGLTSDEKRWQAMLNMQYKTLLSNSNFSISRSQSPGSTGSINETNQIIAGWMYSLSEKEELGLDFNWVQNLSLNKAENKRTSVNYTRQISLLWDFRLSLQQITIDDKITSVVSSNSAMVSVIYKLPDF